MSNIKNCKLVIVGDGSVGKTCSLISYTTNAFPSDYVPTVFDDYSALVEVDGYRINLGLWDTAGQEEYKRLRPLSYPATNIFWICYDIGNQSSFDNIETNWIPEINEHCPNTPFVIIGMKSDLKTDKNFDKSLLVSTEIASEYAKSKKAWGFYETSALKQEGLKTAYDETMRKFIQFENRKQKKDCILL